MTEKEVELYFACIVDTRPEGQTFLVVSNSRKGIEEKLLNEEFFEDLPVSMLPELARVARKVKQGHTMEFPKGVLIGLTALSFTGVDVVRLFGSLLDPKGDPKKKKSDSPEKKKSTVKPGSPRKKKPASTPTRAKAGPKAGARTSKNPKVSKTSKGVFLVESPSDTHLKKLRKGVKNIGGSVRKVPSKDDYVVTISKGGTIKGLKEFMA